MGEDENVLTFCYKADMSVLNGCRRAYGAGYQHGDRKGCLRGTRENVLNEVELWREGFDQSPIFWLNGLAGTGKTTIAQTVSERLFADGCLGASFFCSRGFEDRNDLRFIFPTLAFQLAHKYPTFRSSFIPVLQSNPDVLHESLQEQMHKLLVVPLQGAAISTVVVIDALDECKDGEPESTILLVLGQSAAKIPGVKFFITSRPEVHIVSGFRRSLLEALTDVFVLHHVEPCTINNDIRCFFKHELSKLSQRCGGVEVWPTNKQLDSLCQRAAGFFIYAVATINFLDHKFQDPSDRLNMIMQSPEITTHEARVRLKASYTSLDSLYMSIFQAAFIDNDPDDDAMVCSVLSTVVLAANPLSQPSITTLTGLRSTQVQRLLESIQSLLILPKDPNDPVQPFHKSFPDFITDPARCVNTRFYVPPNYHLKLALNCLKVMGKLLKRNMCSIPDYALNSKVEDLPEKIKESGIPGALEYACRSWYKHLITTEDQAVDMVSALLHFLEEKFLFWLEVLSVLGAVGDAAHALIKTRKWLNEVCSKQWLDSWPLGVYLKPDSGPH